MAMGTGTEMGQSKEAFCPACKYFGQDCTVEVDDWEEPCDAYEEAEERSWIWL